MGPQCYKISNKKQIKLNLSTIYKRKTNRKLKKYKENQEYEATNKKEARDTEKYNIERPEYEYKKRYLLLSKHTKKQARPLYTEPFKISVLHPMSKY